jgi:periplasmic divalent cation tolerance protein
VVLVTHPVQGAAEFARALVRARVAACVNRLPVDSVYRWQGAVQEDGEELLIVKTSGARLAELERLLAELHPYEVPECIALAPERVAAPYLAWWLAETRPEGHASR